MTELCSTLEQQWSACRAPVYNLWEAKLDLHLCVSWWGQWLGTGYRENRPCTSPRRRHCRPGGIRRWCWVRSEGEQEYCRHPLHGVRASDWLRELDA